MAATASSGQVAADAEVATGVATVQVSLAVSIASLSCSWRHRRPR
ncbi:hypothetical protein [Cupriavidus sp. EM10]|nr:hypothetical protein [Cupriavidus sp. EM10]